MIKRFIIDFLPNLWYTNDHGTALRGMPPPGLPD